MATNPQQVSYFCLGHISQRDQYAELKRYISDCGAQDNHYYNTILRYETVTSSPFTWLGNKLTASLTFGGGGEFDESDDYEFVDLSKLPAYADLYAEKTLGDTVTFTLKRRDGKRSHTLAQTQFINGSPSYILDFNPAGLWPPAEFKPIAEKPPVSAVDVSEFCLGPEDQATTYNPLVHWLLQALGATPRNFASVDAKRYFNTRGTEFRVKKTTQTIEGSDALSKLFQQMLGAEHVIITPASSCETYWLMDDRGAVIAKSQFDILKTSLCRYTLTTSEDTASIEYHRPVDTDTRPLSHVSETDGSLDRSLLARSRDSSDGDSAASDSVSPQSDSPRLSPRLDPGVKGKEEAEKSDPPLPVDEPKLPKPVAEPLSKEKEEAKLSPVDKLEVPKPVAKPLSISYQTPGQVAGRRIAFAIAWAAIIYGSVLLFAFSPTTFMIGFALYNGLQFLLCKPVLAAVIKKCIEPDAIGELPVVAANAISNTVNKYADYALWIAPTLLSLAWTGILAGCLYYFAGPAILAQTLFSAIGFTHSFLAINSSIVTTFFAARFLENVFAATLNIVDSLICSLALTRLSRNPDATLEKRSWGPYKLVKETGADADKELPDSTLWAQRILNMRSMRYIGNSKMKNPPTLYTLYTLNINFWTNPLWVLSYLLTRNEECSEKSQSQPSKLG